MSDEMIDDTMFEYDFGYPFQCLCGAWDIWDNGMECDICGRRYIPKDDLTDGKCVQADALLLHPKSVDVSFTSPPYNRKRNDKYKNYTDQVLKNE